MRFNLTDEEWALLEPPMPERRKSAALTTVRSGMRFSTCCAPACRGAICPSGTAPTQRPIIASTAGLGVASGSKSLIRSR